MLATAHAVSEGIIRGVAGEMARQTAPKTYGMSGRPNAPRMQAVPLALSRLREQGRVATGDLALLLAFGAGLTWAGQVVEVC